MGKLGKVYLVGAGPGDPGMVTLRGAECLQKADVVLYDYLVNPEVLRHARPGVSLQCLGRDSQGRTWRQSQISGEIVRLAEEGRCVVRLKGGDPLIFARIVEETEQLVSRGIPFEIVPGVTSALAAAACAGIPLTHRNLASAVALVAGQEKAGKSGPPLDYRPLADFPGTLVFYMGARTVGSWAPALLEAGKSADCPVAIVWRCSLPDQTTTRCTLGDLANDPAISDGLRPPVVIVVGEVAAATETLAWFEQRPLFGQAVLVTRPAHQAESLVEPLISLGAEVLLQPAIEIAPPRDWAPVDAALERIHQFDWLVFSSVNGVRYCLDRLLANGKDVRSLASLQLAAIGPATAAELNRYSLNADLQAPVFDAESLAGELSSLASGKRFLLARASRGREVLAVQLVAAGAEVEQVVVYQSCDVDQPASGIADRLSRGEVEWVTVTSSAIARSLWAMFGDELRKTRLASISPITTATLSTFRLEPAAEAREFTMAGVVDAILEAVQR